MNRSEVPDDSSVVDLKNNQNPEWHRKMKESGHKKRLGKQDLIELMGLRAQKIFRSQ